MEHVLTIAEAFMTVTHASVVTVGLEIIAKRKLKHVRLSHVWTVPLVVTLVKDTNANAMLALVAKGASFKCKIAVPIHAPTVANVRHWRAINTNAIARKDSRERNVKRTSMIAMEIHAKMEADALMATININANAHSVIRAPFVRSKSTSVWRNLAQMAAVAIT